MAKHEFINGGGCVDTTDGNWTTIIRIFLEEGEAVSCQIKNRSIIIWVE